MDATEQVQPIVIRLEADAEDAGMRLDRLLALKNPEGAGI
jgi:hypothetical protein